MASAKRLLQVHLKQQWYDLSDPAMEDALIDVATMRRFAGIALISDRILDETTILAFRRLLEPNDLDEQIFEDVNEHLKANGMAMKQRTIVDTTIIAAASSTKNEKRGQDPEMHQTKKGHQWYFGMYGETERECGRRGWSEPGGLRQGSGEQSL